MKPNATGLIGEKDWLLYHKPIKRLQKERVPINIVVDTNQHRKELSDDRKACRTKYNCKSLWRGDPIYTEDSDNGVRNRDQSGHARDWEQSISGWVRGVGSGNMQTSASRMAEYRDRRTQHIEQYGMDPLPETHL
jgi:hypothetical protein